jgi:hypothetical protein
LEVKKVTLYVVLEDVFLSAGQELVGVFNDEELAKKIAAICDGGEVVACNINEPAVDYAFESDREKVRKAIHEHVASRNPGVSP